MNEKYDHHQTEFYFPFSRHFSHFSTNYKYLLCIHYTLYYTVYQISIKCVSIRIEVKRFFESRKFYFHP